MSFADKYLRVSVNEGRQVARDDLGWRHDEALASPQDRLQILGGRFEPGSEQDPACVTHPAEGKEIGGNDPVIHGICTPDAPVHSDKHLALHHMPFQQELSPMQTQFVQMQLSAESCELPVRFQCQRSMP